MTALPAEWRWLHPEVAVFTGAFWETNCTVVRRGNDVLLIDSPVLPDELEQLRVLLDQAGLRVTQRLVTHAHWDHLLAGCAWPQAPVACAQATAADIATDPGRQHRHVAEFDAEHGVARPPLLLRLDVALDVPGTLAFGDAQIELIQADGHSADGMACWLDSAEVLVCGDYMSPGEVPQIGEGGSSGAYIRTLHRLEPFVLRADSVVPGHGAVIDAKHAARLLAEDLAYMEALRSAPEQAQAPVRGSAAKQLDLHHKNLARVQGVSGSGPMS